ncbi:hypothetical protein [Fulvimarina sp. MAC3]|uniref:hypothetical protein n=1 Tax=Fulvimarina sp. MAC3 TaxID=3148887 RepID=UPI0031FDB12B
MDTVVLAGNSTDYTGSRSFRSFELSSQDQSVELRGVKRVVFDDREVDLTDGGEAFDALFVSMDDADAADCSGVFSHTFPGSSSFGSQFEASANDLFEFASADFDMAMNHQMVQQDPYDFNPA